MACETVAQKAIAYNMPGIRVDGNDVLAVYVATKEAVDRARAGGGPSLIEGLTYRLTPHTTADDPKRYRSDATTDEWMKKEPLIRFAKYLQNKGVMSAKDLEDMEVEVDTLVKAAVTKAEEMAKSEELLNPYNIIDHVFADVPQFLQEQRDELGEYMKRENDRKAKKNAKKSETGALS